MPDPSSAPRRPAGENEPSPEGEAEAVLDRPWIVRDGFFRLVIGYEQGSALLADHRLDADLAGLMEGAGIDSGPAHDALVHSFLSMNGEVHRRYRSLVADRFTPRAVEQIRPLVADLASTCAEGIQAGAVDVLAEFASPYVAAGTCSHIGMPVDDYGGLAEAVRQVGDASKDPGSRAEMLAAGIDALVSYARRALRGEVRLEPGRVGATLSEHVAAGRMPEDVAAVLIATMLSAGNEPTVNQIGLSLTVLADHPDLWEALGAGTAPIARVAEELLRFHSTNRAVNRKVVESLTLDDIEFPEGEQVFIGLARCNHDPNRFQRPDELDPEANAGSNLAFGLGAHYCLGASLARLQLQEALRALTVRFRCPEVIRAEESEGGGLLSHRLLVLQMDPRS